MNKRNRRKKRKLGRIYQEIFVSCREPMQTYIDRALFDGRIDSVIHKRFQIFINESPEMDILRIRLKGIQYAYEKWLDSKPYNPKARNKKNVDS